MILLAILLLAGGQPALANAGDCAWVQGRYAVYNGSSVKRIWMTGTTRMLALYDSDTDLPPPMKRVVESGRFVPSEARIHGDFLVCARDRRVAGHMQHIRLKDAKNLVVAPR